MPTTPPDHHSHPDSQPAATPLRDPVCGMTVKPDSTFHAMHQGQHFLFCSQHWLDKFCA